MKFISDGKVVLEIDEKGSWRPLQHGTSCPNPKDAYEYLTEGQFLPRKSAMIIIRGMFTQESIDAWQKEATDD